MTVKSRFEKARRRGVYAAKGAFVGALIGGFIGRKYASIGGAVGASVGALAGDTVSDTRTRVSEAERPERLRGETADAAE